MMPAFGTQPGASGWEKGSGGGSTMPSGTWGCFRHVWRNTCMAPYVRRPTSSGGNHSLLQHHVVVVSDTGVQARFVRQAMSLEGCELDADHESSFIRTLTFRRRADLKP